MCAPVAQENDLGHLDEFPPLPPVASDRAVKGFGEGMVLGVSLTVNKNSARAKGGSYYWQKAQAKQSRADWKGERP